MEFCIKDCPVENVVVFLDQAEVTRKVKARLVAGETQIVLNDLSPSIDKDSIRVEGSGAATINEVVYSSEKTQAVEKNDENTQGEAKNEKQQLQAKEKDLRRQQESLGLKRKRIETQILVLEGLAEHVTKSGKAKPESGDFVDTLSDETLQGVARFFDLHKREMRRLDEEHRKTRHESDSIAAELKMIDEKLKKLMPKREKGNFKREIIIMLEAKKDTDVELLVSYLVKDASWSPKYDLRVFSKEKKIQINYFGMIKQCTGEEWTEASVELSTAMPSVGGMAPVLPTVELGYGRIMLTVGVPKGRGRPMKRLNLMSSGFGGGGVDTYGEDSDVDDLVECSAALPSSSIPEISVPTTEVKSGITGTTFKVPRQSTIPSDDTGHKVTVAQVPLDPSFEYESVPKLAAFAFLKAKVRNSSPYSLLAGPANVFLDNNFVAKSSLKSVSPDEEFECSLGVDPSVRVVYKPVQKFREHFGLFTKMTQVKMQQHVEIKNTKADPIKIVVTDQLPLSSDEKIKVTLTEPEFRKGDKKRQLGESGSVELNKSNNLEWTVHVKPQETHTIKLHYTVEYPQTERIQGL